MCLKSAVRGPYKTQLLSYAFEGQLMHQRFSEVWSFRTRFQRTAYHGYNRNRQTPTIYFKKSQPSPTKIETELSHACNVVAFQITTTLIPSFFLIGMDYVFILTQNLCSKSWRVMIYICNHLYTFLQHKSLYGNAITLLKLLYLPSALLCDPVF